MVVGHRIHIVRQVLPGTGHTLDFGLTAQLAFGADFTSHTADFRGKAVQLVHHRVDGFFELKNFTAHVHSDLPRQVTCGDGRSDVRDVPDLVSEVTRHGVDVVGQVFPGTGHAGHDGLATQFAFRADFAGHARHFCSESAQLFDHRRTDDRQVENLALHIHHDFAREVAPSHRRRHFSDVANLIGEVASHGIDVVGQILPRAGYARHQSLATELAFRADFAGHACHF